MTLICKKSKIFLFLAGLSLFIQLFIPFSQMTAEKWTVHLLKGVFYNQPNALCGGDSNPIDHSDECLFCILSSVTDDDLSFDITPDGVFFFWGVFQQSLFRPYILGGFNRLCLQYFSTIRAPPLSIFL